MKLSLRMVLLDRKGFMWLMYSEDGVCEDVDSYCQ